MTTTKEKIEAILLTAGCDTVFYESNQLANVTADQFEQGNIVGYVIEPTQGTILIAGGGATIQFNPWVVEIIEQVRPEDNAENNDTILAALLNVARKFIVLLAHDSSLGKISNTPFIKVQENRYDANMIGWSMNLSLSPIEYESNC